MRVCYLASDPRMRLSAPTGYGSHIRKTIAAFERHGISVVRMIAGDMRDISKVRNAYRRLGQARISRSLRLAKAVARDLHEILDDYRSTIHYGRILSNTPCDFIYERMAPFRTVGLRLARRFNIPLILEVNDPLFETFKYYFVPLKRYALMKERRLVDGATGIIVGSRRLGDYYARQGVVSGKMRVVYPTADCELFRTSAQPDQNARLDGNPAKVRIGFVGNMNPWHRVDLLIKAFENVARNKNLELLLIGEGPESESLQEMVRDRKLETKVRFLGSVKYELVPGLLESFDICVIPHATWYGSPTKLFEYGAMGKAVIGPRETPVDEILEHGATGILFTPGDHKERSVAMERLSGDAETRRALGAALHAKVRNEITWSKNIDTILALTGRKAVADGCRPERDLVSGIS